MYPAYASSLRLGGEPDDAFEAAVTLLEAELARLGLTSVGDLRQDGQGACRNRSARWLVHPGAGVELVVDHRTAEVTTHTIAYLSRERTKARLVAVEEVRTTHAEALLRSCIAPVPWPVSTLMADWPIVDSTLAVHDTPQTVGAEQIGELVCELTDPGRQLPVVVLSRPRGRYHLDPAEVARTLAGLAHVRSLAGDDASRRLSAAVGQHRSTYGGAIRSYAPGFHRDDDPRRHPFWTRRVQNESGRVQRQLRQELTAIVAATLPALGPVARLRPSVQRRGAAANTSAHDRPWPDGALEPETARLEAEVATLRAELREAQTVIDEQAAGMERFRSVAEAVNAAAETFTAGAHLVWLPEAFAAAAASPYRRPDRVYTALGALAEAAQRYAADALYGGFGAFFAQAGLRYAAGASDTAKGKWAHEYQRTWNGSRIWLGPHLKLGSGPPESCCRIYWYVDPAHRRLVVGHVGQHLTDTNT